MCYSYQQRHYEKLLQSTQWLRRYISSKVNRLHKLTPIEEHVLGIQDQGDRDRPYIALKYFNGKHECFSEWQADELKAFTELQSKLAQMTWSQIHRSSGKNNKTGIAYTRVSSEDVPEFAEKNLLSKDITFSEMRVTKKARLFGFRVKSVFYVVALDRGHKVFG